MYTLTLYIGPKYIFGIYLVKIGSVILTLDLGADIELQAHTTMDII